MADETEVGRIVAYLTLQRGDWTAGVRDTKRDAAELGRLSPTIRIDTNADKVILQLAGVKAAEDRVGKGASDAQKPLIGLWGALAALAPAAVPIAAVAGGALAGLVPVIATVALGIKGITAAEKDGSLAGTRYATDLATLSAEGKKLQQIAAGGLLQGIDKGLAQSHGLFATVNADVGQMSSQLGDIVAGAAPALLRILTELDPLFVTIGDDLSKGAHYLEHWATSSDGVSKFVGYVQAELPTVEQLIGNLIVLLAHLAQGAAPFGGVLLSDITLFVRALDSIPVGVLRTAIPLAVSLYAAFKAYAIITAVVKGVTAAVTTMGNAFGLTGPKAAAAAAAQNAASLSIQATAAEEAAAVARAKAAEAAATAEASVEIAASLEGTSSALAAEAAAAAEAAVEFSAAMEAEATAATAAAGTIGAEAAEAAATSEAAGAAASAGWAAMLGPIGAVVVGVGLLGTTMLGGSQDTMAAKQATDSYTQALIQSKGAIDDNVRAQVAKNLSDAGALEAARTLGISQRELVTAITSGGPALSDLRSQLDAATGSVQGMTKKQAEAIVTLDQFNANTAGIDETTTSATGAIAKLRDILGPARRQFENGAQAARDQRAAIGGAADAARSLTTALETLAQAQLARAQSQDQFLESVQGVTQAIKQNGNSLGQNTAKGLANRDAFLNSASAALSYHDAQVKAGVSTTAANKTLADNIQQLAQQAIKAGASKDQVHALLAQLNLLPSEIRTAIKVDTSNARHNVENLVRYINGQVAYVQVRTTGGGQAPSGGRAYLDTGPNGVPRAVGGTGVAGRSYLVGDAGKPEIFVPDQSGRFMTMQDAARAAASRSRSDERPPVQVTVYAPQSIDPEAAGWAVGRHVQATVGVAV